MRSRFQATSQNWKSSERKEEGKAKRGCGTERGMGGAFCISRLGASKTRQSQKRRSGEWDGCMYVHTYV